MNYIFCLLKTKNFNSFGLEVSSRIFRWNMIRFRNGMDSHCNSFPNYWHCFVKICCCCLFFQIKKYMYIVVNWGLEIARVPFSFGIIYRTANKKKNTTLAGGCKPKTCNALLKSYITLKGKRIASAVLFYCTRFYFAFFFFFLFFFPLPLLLLLPPAILRAVFPTFYLVDRWSEHF